MHRKLHFILIKMVPPFKSGRYLTLWSPLSVAGAGIFNFAYSTLTKDKVDT